MLPVGDAASAEPPRGGFTLIELLVVMIIIAILAAIAVPTIITQRGKAFDTVTRTDARYLGAGGAWLVPGEPGRPERADRGGPVRGGRRRRRRGRARASAVHGADPAVVDTTGWTSLAWCLGLTNPRGAVQTIKVSAQQGLQSGACTSPTAP